MKSQRSESASVVITDAALEVQEPSSVALFINHMDTMQGNVVEKFDEFVNEVVAVNNLH